MTPRIADKWQRFISQRNNLQNKIFLPFVAVMVLIGILIIYIMTDLVSANVEARVNDKLESDVKLVQEIVSDMETSLAFYAQFIADTEQLVGHINEARDSRLILIYLLEFLKTNQILSNIGGDSPLHGDVKLNRLGMLGIRATGLIAENFNERTNLSLAAVSPIEGHTGSRSVITVSKKMDQGFLQELTKKTDAFRIQLFYQERLAASSSVEEECDKEIAEILTPEIMTQVLAEDVPFLSEFSCNDHSIKMILAPLRVNFKKEALVAIHESTDDLARARRNIIVTTVVVVGLTLLIIVPIYILTVSRLVAPLNELSKASRAVAEGKLDQYVPVRTKDEVGELSESFNRMIDDLKQYREDIENWNQTLEDRVAERTTQLAEAQAKLIHSEKLAAVGELAAGIAHELNNPLAGIYAFLQVFVERIRSRGLKQLSEEEASSFQENLVHVEREIQRCKSIIGSLLTFARVSEKDFMPLSLNKVIQDTLAFTQSNLIKSEIDVATNFNEDIPLVLGDSNELQQVFLNIIVNARKAMPEGGRLEIVTERGKDGHSAQVSISDTGEGIDDEVLDKIFDPFFTTRKPGEGTGLGLSISYSIIKEHNGEIFVESKRGKGTTFTLVLPAVEKEKANDLPPPGIDSSKSDTDNTTL